MNYRQKYLSVCIAALLGGASPAFAAAPSLGAAADFAVLSAPSGSTTGGTAAQGTAAAAGAVTCTDSTIIGDVGSSGARPSVVKTRCTITGAIIAPVATGVLADYYSAYDTLAAMSCTPLTRENTGTTEPRDLSTLAGVTLAPGTYCVDAVAKTGVLTLNGDGIWIFKVAADQANPLTGALTGTNFSVVLNNGATACNVYWWVAQAATMTTSDFKGTILAGAAITTTTSTPPGAFEGRALAGRNSVTAGVTLTDVAFVGCEGGSRGSTPKSKCNQGVGNGPEFCDPGNSNQSNRYPNLDNPFLRSNDETSLTTPGGVQGNPGRKNGNK